jgi:hypothetical protein
MVGHMELSPLLIGTSTLSNVDPLIFNLLFLSISLPLFGVAHEKGRWDMQCNARQREAEPAAPGLE